MAREAVNEGSTAYLTVSFTDKNGSPAAPSSVSYRIDCLTTGTTVRGSTSVTPGATVEIVLTPADNDIVGGRAREVRRVTIEASYGVDDAVCAQYDYEVVNLSAVA